MSRGWATPMVSTTAWAVGSYVLVLGLHLSLGGSIEVSVRAFLACLAGALYTNLFEHAWHRYAMHGRRPDRRHALHHRIFYGNAFQTSEPAALQEIVTARYIFPILLAVHYPIFILLFPATLAPMFFLGVVVHFVVYEVTHWYTHVADNQFDRVVSRIPVVRQLRAAQVRHHRLHHANPRVNFNFNPPYAGDRVTRVLQR